MLNQDNRARKRRPKRYERLVYQLTTLTSSGLVIERYALWGNSLYYANTLYFGTTNSYGDSKSILVLHKNIERATKSASEKKKTYHLKVPSYEAWSLKLQSPLAQSWTGIMRTGAVGLSMLYSTLWVRCACALLCVAQHSSYTQFRPVSLKPTLCCGAAVYAGQWQMFDMLKRRNLLKV